ncbi:MAG: hypothetical protein ACI4OT_04825 [Bacilli bacterium]
MYDEKDYDKETVEKLKANHITATFSKLAQCDRKVAKLYKYLKKIEEAYDNNNSKNIKKYTKKYNDYLEKITKFNEEDLVKTFNEYIKDLRKNDNPILSYMHDNFSSFFNGSSLNIKEAFELYIKAYIGTRENMIKIEQEKQKHNNPTTPTYHNEDYYNSHYTDYSIDYTAPVHTETKNYSEHTPTPSEKRIEEEQKLKRLIDDLKITDAEKSRYMEQLLQLEDENYEKGLLDSHYSNSYLVFMSSIEKKLKKVESSKYGSIFSKKYQKSIEEDIKGLLGSSQDLIKVGTDKLIYDLKDCDDYMQNARYNKYSIEKALKEYEKQRQKVQKAFSKLSSKKQHEIMQQFKDLNIKEIPTLDTIYSEMAKGVIESTAAKDYYHEKAGKREPFETQYYSSFKKVTEHMTNDEIKKLYENVTGSIFYEISPLNPFYKLHISNEISCKKVKETYEKAQKSFCEVYLEKNKEAYKDMNKESALEQICKTVFKDEPKFIKKQVDTKKTESTTDEFLDSVKRTNPKLYNEVMHISDDNGYENVEKKHQ